MGRSASVPAGGLPGGIVRDMAAGLAVGAAYWAMVAVGLRWAVLPGAGTPVWPAAGIAVAGLVLGGSRLWPAIFLARLGTLLTDDSAQALWIDLAIAGGTTLAAYLPALALERSRPLDPRLGSLRDMAWLTVGGGLAGALVSATIGVGALWAGGLPGERVAHAWLTWASGYFVGVLTVAPLVLSWWGPAAARMSPRAWGHLAACLAAVGALSATVFLSPQSFWLRVWHIMPALVWAALAFQVRGVSAALAVTSVCAIAGAVAGTGPLASEDAAAANRVLLTQQFIAIVALTKLFLAAAVHERRRVEDIGRLAAIVSSSPEAILSFDREGRIDSWNGGAEALFGWTAAQALGRGTEIIVPPGNPGVPALLPRVLAGETLAIETVRVGKDGLPIEVALTAAPVRAPDGGVLGALTVIRDIRERKRAEDALHRLNDTLEQRVADRTRALEEANAVLRDEIRGREEAEARVRQMQKMESLGQLTGGIAHDFNNMLAVVIGNLAMVRRRAGALDERAARLVENAMEGANRAARLTARLLAFSRQQPLSPEPADVNRLVSGMSELLRRTLGEEHRIESVLADDLWPTLVDTGGLENAIVNLAVNARDAMPGGGRLTIRTGNVRLDGAGELPPGDYVRVSVSDTGTGIPEHIRERVFDPFFTTKEPGKGTGLGLSMVYGFVKQSGGHVRLAPGEGGGTDVEIHLPRWHGAGTLAEEPAGDGAAPRAAAGEVVLVVEDEAEVRRTSVAMLEELGYRVIEAADAARGLDQLRARPDVALLFTDVVMPGMDGRRLAELARALRPDLRVLHTTGFARAGERREDALPPGAAVLPKPFTLEALADRVREAIEAPRADLPPDRGAAAAAAARGG